MPTPRLLALLALLPLACTTSPDTTTSASSSTTVESTSAAESTAAESTESLDTQATHDEPTAGAHTSTTEHTTGSTGELTPVDAYCACMLVQCHEQYHGTWGEEHESSQAMCVAAAEALPTVGMPATMGNSLECRHYYCELGEAEPGACDSAIGGGACV